MKLTDIVGVLDEIAPQRYAESWDNVGLIVGDPAGEVAKVLVTVDYTSEVAAEAVASGAGLVVAYHPPLFAAVKRVPHDALWADAIRRGIGLYSPHTALDVAREGTNDFLADACGVSRAERRPLRPFIPKGSRIEPAGLGLGRIGAIEPTSRRALVDRIKTELALGYVLVAGPVHGEARSVAVAAGAGGELIEDAIRGAADVFVTGEIRHHDALSAARRGVTVIATLHSNSERAAIRAYASRLATRLPALQVTFSDADRDPFTVV